MKNLIIPRICWIAILALTLIVNSPGMSLNAQDGTGGTMDLSLEQAIEMALTRNYDIQLEALNSELSYANLVGAFGIYDLTLNMDLTTDAAEQRQFSTFSASERDSQSLQTSLSKNMEWGSRLAVVHTTGRSASNSATANLNPSYDNALVIDVTQPLWRDFGRDITERQIRINRNNLRQSTVDFENQVIVTIADLKNRYLNLVATYEALKVAEDSLELAKQQLEKNRIQVEIGTMPEIEIIQAEQTVAQRESELLDSQAAIRQAEDNLKSALVMDDWSVTIRPTDTLQEPGDAEYDYEEALAKALQNRPEIRRLEIALQTNDINIDFNKNQLRPTLDMNANYRIYSSGGNFQPSIFGEAPPDDLPLSYRGTVYDTFRLENYNWSVGATFTYIFGNSTAKSNLEASQIQKRQNFLRKDQLRYTIAVDVRDAIRELESAVASLEARRKALTFAERQFEAEQEKFEVGTSTNFEVLNFQNALVSARNQVIIAQIRYNRALIDYDRVTGSILTKNNIVIESDEMGSAGAVIK